MIEVAIKLMEERVEGFVKRLAASLYEKEIDLHVSWSPVEGKIGFNERERLEYRKIRKGEPWGSNWQRAWFHVQGRIPDQWKGKSVCARINLGGEALVFSSEGEPLQALSVHSIWAGVDFRRDRVRLASPVQGGEPVEFWIEAGAGQLFGVKLNVEKGIHIPKTFGSYEALFNEAVMAVFRPDIERLYFDFQVLQDLMRSLPAKNVRRRRILSGLNQGIDVYSSSEEGVARCLEFIQSLLHVPADPSDLFTIAVGHAHLDTAWLWPVEETVYKCARTFAAQVALLDRYPSYVFGASQPQHYLFVKEHYPRLFEMIRAKVEEGRWEPQGAMWVEADCNLISGESMVRQILYGKQFFRDEFGVDVDNLWLPDVFGYSAALPQIMKKSGLSSLVTQKISWNQFNRFPHHTFRWRGIDGSEVTVHFPPEDNYNSELLPSALRKAQENFDENDCLEEFLTLFGIGDGGCGPTEEIIESGIRQADLNGSPRVVFGRAGDFLRRLNENSVKLPVWSGELFLEAHRGTLTTHACNKKMNRLLENLLKKAEMWLCLLPAKEYPRKELQEIWKQVLLFQFHDIIPGSSIPLVYEECRRIYPELVRSLSEWIEKAAARLLPGEEGAICLFNTSNEVFNGSVMLPAGWRGKEVRDGKGNRITLQDSEEGVLAAVSIPPLQFSTLRPGEESRPEGEASPTGSPMILENELVRYSFTEEGVLTAIEDLETGRAVMSSSQQGNRLELFEDRPVNWDAWDIDLFYENQFLERAVLDSRRRLPSGRVRQGLEFRFNIGSSSIHQKIYLEYGSKRLDFHTEVEWNETHKLLRVAFPVDIHAREAAYEIQFGHVFRPTHRNTSWDIARFESVAHRFVDLSESDYGVALLNDCKYGHKVLENELSLSLLRSPLMPDPTADRGHHELTYSLLPHSGGLRESGVWRHAAVLNDPLLVFPGRCSPKTSIPFGMDSGGISLHAIKRAESGDGIILRFCESCGMRGRLTLEVSVGEAWEADLLENPIHRIKTDGKKLEFLFTPFEVKTILLRESGSRN